jgi:hypothetical protein
LRDFVAILLKRGADLYARDKTGQTPLDLLSSEGQQQLLALREKVLASTEDKLPVDELTKAKNAVPSTLEKEESFTAFRQIEDPTIPMAWHRTPVHSRMNQGTKKL